MDPVRRGVHGPGVSVFGSPKKKGGEKAKSKSQDCCITFKPFSAHAQTSQADVLHLDQKAAKCATCKPVCGKF